MIVSLLIVGGIILIIGMILAFLSKDFKPSQIVAIAALIVVAGTIIGIIGKYIQDINSSKKQGDILDATLSTKTGVEGLTAQGVDTYEKLQTLEIENKKQGDTIKANNIKQQKDANKIIALQGEVGQKADSLIQAGIESKNLYKELYTVQKELLNYQTGGDSWCFVRLALQADHTLTVFLYHMGEHTLPDLRIKITRTSANIREAKGDPITLKGFVINEKNTTKFPTRALTKPREARDRDMVIGTIPFDFGLDEKYSASFSTDYNQWSQSYELDYKGNFYKSSTKVIRHGIILMEE